MVQAGKFFISTAVVFWAVISCNAQETVSLYRGQIPNSVRSAHNEEYSRAGGAVVFKVSDPTLSIYLPPADKATGTAVIICPGGGYSALVIDREGYDMAKRFREMGVAAFVLKYRLPSDRTMINKSVGPLEDAQEAIRMVRENAEKWRIRPDKIGIMGFSAGGHLASTAGTHFDSAFIPNEKGTSLRPDFMILVYPVISMTDSIGHIGSRDNLLGKDPPDAMIRQFSNELHVTAGTPPAFIIQAGDDAVVKVANSIRFFESLHLKGIPAALHIYQKGGHGFLKYPPRDMWMPDLKHWMECNGWLGN